MAKVLKICPKCNKKTEEISHSIIKTFNSRLVNLSCGHSYTEKLLEAKNWESFAAQRGIPHKLRPFQGRGYEFARESGFRCLIADEPGLGKGQILTDKILTPTGWKLFKNIQVGDLVVGYNGQAQTITGVFDRGILPTYKVTFNDGATVTVDGEHLWKVNTSTRISRGVAAKVIQTKDLIGNVRQSTGKAIWRIPVVNYVQFYEQIIPINPYVLGLLLGDGSFSTPSRVKFSSNDEELVREIERYYNIRKTSGKYDFEISGVIKAITELKLAGTKSNNKFVPDIYKFNTYQTRLSVLQGLMDTDGSIWNNGVIEYSTVSEQLKDDIVFLVQSLGGTTRVSTKIPTYTYKGEKKQGQLAYRVIINCPVNPFNLFRKQRQYKDREKYTPSRSIISIEPAGEQEIRCISVSNPDKLYITNEFIVTHNTVQALSSLYYHPELLPALIVCKAAVKLQLAKAIMTWMGMDFMPQVIENGKDRPSKLCPIVIVTYELLWRIQKQEIEKSESVEKSIRERLGVSEWFPLPDDEKAKIPAIKNPFSEYKFQSMILDEVQQIKNPQSRRAVQVMSIGKDIPHILALSGTPIKNHAGEYFPILNLLRPEMFPSYKRFVNEECDSYTTNRGFAKVGGLRDMESFHEKTKDFIIRRTRQEVLPELPIVDRKFVEADFASKKMESAYKTAQDEFQEAYEEDNKSFEGMTNLLAKMAKLRHLAGLNKVPFAVDWIRDFLLDTETSRKLVVFVHHQDVGQLLTAALTNEIKKENENGSTLSPPVEYTASLDSEARQKVINDFISNPTQRVLVASTKAMGEGVDGLQYVCSDYVMLERQWTPSDEEQAEGRFIRFGAEGKESINGNYILSMGTIDEYFTELVEKKRSILSQTMDGVEYVWDQQSLMKELADILATKGNKKWTL